MRIIPHQQALSILLFILIITPISGFGQSSVISEQRRINELAAIFSRALSAISDPRTSRRTGETLEVYMTRLVARNPTETEQGRTARIEGYLNALEKAKKEANSWRRPVGQVDLSEGNRKLWSSVWKSVDALPARVAKTKSVCRRFKAGDEGALGAELSASLRTLKAGIDALRDARS